jgi:hypothetical protein
MAEDQASNLEKLNQYMGEFVKINDSMYKSLASSTTAMKTVTDATRSMGAVLSDTVGFAGTLVEKFGETGLAGKVNETGKSIKGFSEGLIDAAKVGGTIIEILDSQSAGFRKLDAEYLRYTRSFGEGIEYAKELSSSLATDRVSEFGKAYHLTAEDVSAFNKALLETNIGLENSFSDIDAGTQGLKFYSAAMAVAAASGMDTYKAVNTLNDIISKQGVTAESALEILSGYSDISKNTGLNIDTVNQSLSSSISGFQKMGATVDFARPILEGFAKSFKEVGLGVEEAANSAQGFSQSLARMSTDYTLSYIMSSRGGFGNQEGANILGSSIETRAKMIEAGDDVGKQGDIAVEMAKSLKEAVESFTGSSLITLKEAAKDSSLQTTFYLQEQMMSKFTGVSDVAALDRIMEMLPEIGKKEKMGDDEGARNLAAAVQKATSERDAILGEGEKFGIDVQNKIAEQMNMTRETAESAISLAKEVTSLISGFDDRYSLIGDAYSGVNEIYKSLADKIRSGDVKEEELKEYLKNIEMPELPDGKDIAEAKDEASEAIGALIQKISDVFERNFPGGKIVIELSEKAMELVTVNGATSTSKISGASPK